MTDANFRVIYPADPSAEWFTPASLRALAHEILGEIDLDPATSMRNPSNPMRARHALTRRGLETDWTKFRPRTIWMNSPYGRETGRWLDKLIATLTALRGARALVLVPARPGARWYARATDPTCPDAAQLLCELSGRQRFELADGSPASSPARWASSLLYWGDDRAAVARTLRAHGVVRLGPPSPFKPPPPIDGRQLQIS